MNKKQLIDAIGQLNDSVFAGTEAFDTVSETRFSNATESRGGMRKGRRIFLLAAAAVLLIGGTALAAPLLRGATLRLEKEEIDGEEYYSFRYETDEDARVSVSEIQGDVLADMEGIPKRIAKHNPIDGMLPNAVIRHFNTVDEAISYIGYKNMIFPKLGYDYTSIHTEVLGTNPDGTNRFVPGFIVLQTNQKYTGASTFYFEVIEHIRTDACPENGSVMNVALPPDATVCSTEEVIVNGRTFTVVRQKNESPDRGWEMLTQVYWLENGISFLLSIPHPEDAAECAEQLVTEWMNSFPKR